MGMWSLGGLVRQLEHGGEALLHMLSGDGKDTQNANTGCMGGDTYSQGGVSGKWQLPGEEALRGDAFQHAQSVTQHAERMRGDTRTWTDPQQSYMRGTTRDAAANGDVTTGHGRTWASGLPGEEGMRAQGEDTGDGRRVLASVDTGGGALVLNVTILMPADYFAIPSVIPDLNLLWGFVFM